MFRFLPHPPNSAWLSPIDPNDEETLEQQEAMIEEDFKNILSQEVTGVMGVVQMQEEEQEQEEDDGDDMEEYADDLQMPGEQEL